jgi:hypothetical protein
VKYRLRTVGYGLLWVGWNAFVLIGRLLWPLIALDLWIYRRLFPARWVAALARGDEKGRAWLEWYEVHEPGLFETATGRKPRHPSEIRGADQ